MTDCTDCHCVRASWQ